MNNSIYCPIDSDLDLDFDFDFASDFVVVSWSFQKAAFELKEVEILEIEAVEHFEMKGMMDRRERQVAGVPLEKPGSNIGFDFEAVGTRQEGEMGMWRMVGCEME